VSDHPPVKISIITPSHKQLDWLKLCAASIADQEGVTFEHIIQDANSGPELETWIRKNTKAQLYVERDKNMYDGVNRGLRRARGEICAYLNCDEQYLPGTLRMVADYFDQHPEVDVLFGDSVITSPSLKPLAYRQALIPHRWHTMLCPLSILTCSTFFRRKLVDDEVLFDTDWKNLGDKSWVLRVLARGYRMALLSEPMSLFALTGANLSQQSDVPGEQQQWMKGVPSWIRVTRPLVRGWHFIEKWLYGAYKTHHIDSAWYTPDSLAARRKFPSLSLSWKWPANPTAAFLSTEKPTHRHLFVVGFARSGTSLLYSLLNLHPKIKLLFEADLLSHSLIRTAMLSGQNWWERLDFYNSSCRRHGLQPRPFWKNLRSAKEAATVLYTQYGGSEALYVGEKSPSYYNCLPRLAREFPDARFIIIWRNPHSIISSILTAGKSHYFFSNNSLPLRALVGFEQMQQDVLALRTKGVPVFDLCYEDLAEKPEPQLKAICDFLEIPFTPKMLELDHADTSMFPPGEHHAKVKSGLLERSDRSRDAQGVSVQSEIPFYLARWKAFFGDRLTTRRYWMSGDNKRAGSAEVVQNRLRYKFATFYSEQFTPFIYGFFPLSLLKLYRTLRGKHFAPASSSLAGVPREVPTHPLSISIITPSYKQLPWLKLCSASIADQKGVQVEHIIQDAQSGPELESWVRDNTNARLFVESDSGMYDAVNRGFARATGDIVGMLNSDEQYLEGTLAKVARYFETHPDVDVLFGDALLVSNTGELLSYRRTVPPNVQHIQAVHLNTLACATFVRRSVLDQGFRFDTRWKGIADAVWVVSMLKAGIPVGVMNEPLAVFPVDDKSLGQKSLAYAEFRFWQKETYVGTLWLRPLFVGWHRVVKFCKGAYWPRSMSTRLYTLASPKERVTVHADNVGYRWPHANAWPRPN
jgi:glycosyltransferase involved in cell wall biosynthesis